MSIPKLIPGHAGICAVVVPELCYLKPSCKWGCFVMPAGAAGSIAFLLRGQV